MVFNIVILSDEVDDFRREISIDAEATFLELNDAIMKSCNYKNDQMTAFYLCDDDWEREQEITMVDMNDDPKQEPAPLMERTHLSDLISEEEANHEAKLMFLFDTMCERFLYMQIKSVESHKHLMKPEVTVSKGKAPKQEGDIDELFKGLSEEANSMYGDDEFDPSEIDEEGYQSLDDIEGGGY